jgi:hypothetical protein
VHSDSGQVSLENREAKSSCVTPRQAPCGVESTASWLLSYSGLGETTSFLSEAQYSSDSF